MPIDARIALLGQQYPIEQPDVGQTLAQVAQLRGLQGRNRLQDLQIQAAERQLDEQQGIRRAFQQAYTPGEGFNEERLIGELANVAPQQAYGVQQTQWERQGQLLKQRLELIKTGRETRKAEVEATKTDLEGLRMANQLISQAAAGIQDQSSYAATLQYLRSALPPQYQAAIDEAPSVYDPGFVQRVALATGDAEQNLKREMAQLDATLRIRGQNITQRGQDLQAETTRRGQDLETERATTRQATEARQQTKATENQLRDEFNQLSRDYRTVRDAYSRVQAAGRNPSAVGDIALLFSFLKLLDPGSTVREGEFATTQNAAGVPDRVVAQYNRILRGERLAPETRADFLAQTERLYNRATQNYEALRRQYGDLATRAGASRENVTLDFTATTGSSEAQSPGAAPGKTLTDATIAATMRGLQQRGIQATREQVIDALRKQGYQ